MLGYGSLGSLQQAPFTAAEMRYMGYYANDSFQVSRKLTLTYGLRWELMSPFSERYDRVSVLLPDAVSPLRGGDRVAAEGQARGSELPRLVVTLQRTVLEASVRTAAGRSLPHDGPHRDSRRIWNLVFAERRNALQRPLRHSDQQRTDHMGADAEWRVDPVSHFAQSVPERAGAIARA